MLIIDFYCYVKYLLISVIEFLLNYDRLAISVHLFDIIEIQIGSAVKQSTISLKLP